MDKTKKELVKDIVYKFAELSKITDTKMCDNLVEKLLNLDTDDSIDKIKWSLTGNESCWDTNSEWLPYHPSLEYLANKLIAIREVIEMHNKSLKSIYIDHLK